MDCTKRFSIGCLMKSIIMNTNLKDIKSLKEVLEYLNKLHVGLFKKKQFEDHLKELI